MLTQLESNLVPLLLSPHPAIGATNIAKQSQELLDRTFVYYCTDHCHHRCLHSNADEGGTSLSTSNRRSGTRPAPFDEQDVAKRHAQVRRCLGMQRRHAGRR